MTRFFQAISLKKAVTMEKFLKNVEKGLSGPVTVIMLVFAKKPREKKRMNYYTYSTGKRGDWCCILLFFCFKCKVGEVCR